MTDRILELTMTFLPIAPEILTLSLATLIAMSCIMLIRRYREHTADVLETAYRGELTRVSNHLDRVQGQMAMAFDACEKDRDFGKRS